ncbi:Transketolase domain-containing protein [Emticicia oligotrophica DSM 17448]|uniref:Transketolase domain-containing protein n=1 Tax=Emticicia oligotrophica (strain DSM 17448 / CIP 109782 / MTCC 6937 / GPTSA100-15) TaxID=929562 RepID=A0ABN4AI92_EMTOG|nr:transketolase [Emticicia oligotrophica]AFK01751.1 Transketolase domain-containing protein [Emticicia oligotrophica DSM 17448]
METSQNSSLITHHLSLKSKEYRRKILQYIFNAKAGHTGGDLSIIDILNVLYNRIMNVSPENWESNNRDRFIQSKGHCVEALYVVLADKGFFPEEDLLTICKYNSPYIGHPTKYIRGVEQNTGGLGHGLSIGCGNALAAKKDNSPVKVFTILGDGEMAEGSNWEAFMFAAHYKLDNLCAILDYNKLQITAPNAEVMGLEPLDRKLEAFGWAVRHVDGHNLEELESTLKGLPFEVGKPSFVIAHTVKGKGVSYMENVLKWHHGVPSTEQLALAMEELK